MHLTCGNAGRGPRPCAVPNLPIVVDLALRAPLGGSSVFGDRAVEDFGALDMGGDASGLAGLLLRGLLVQGLVRPVAVVVPGVVGQDLAEMPFAEDQHVVQALAAQCAHEPLRKSVGSP